MNMNEILKPFTEAKAINVGGYFGVVDNNKRNLLKRSDANFDNVMKAIVTAHKELLDNPEMYNEIASIVKSEMGITEVKTR